MAEDRFDVLAWNSANTDMFGDFAYIPEGERNIIKLMFSRPCYRRTMPNWEQDARGLVAKFRLSYGQAAGDAEFSHFTDEIIAGSEDFRHQE